MFSLSIALASLLIAPPAFTPQLHNAERAAEVFTYLASDAFEGRRTNTEGAAKARAFIADWFDEEGLIPSGDDGTWYDHFEWSRENLASGTVETSPAQNVIGLIEGRDDDPNGPILVLTAHYDHVGARPNGDIYNGADDNASGTVALLELAAYFADNPPAHDILFAAFDAEEVGLRGARHFVTDPDAPMDRVAMNLNMDMVSRADNGTLWAVGTYHFPFLISHVDAVAAEAPITLKRGYDEPTGNPRNDWTYLSDQGPFINQGVPAIYLGVEDHPDYHQPTDTAERVDFETYARIVDTVIVLAVLLDADLEEIGQRAVETKAARRAELDALEQE